MSFQNILSRKVEDVEAPKPLPVGPYICVVSKPAAFNERNNFDIVTFNLAVQSAGESVDPDALAEWGGKLQGQNLSRDFLFPKDDPEGQARTEFNLKTFLVDHLGIDPKGKEFKELIDEAQGQSCMAIVSHQQDKEDPSRVYARCNRTGPAD